MAQKNQKIRTMKKLDQLLQEIKTSVFFFQEIAQMKPSKQKAHQLIAIYSIVASQIKEANDLAKDQSQFISLKQLNLVKLLNKNMPKNTDLKALFIALRGVVSLKHLLRIDRNTLDTLYLLLSKEAIDVIDSLDPKTIGPKDDYNLSMDQKAVQNKEKQLLKNLENIVNVLQMNVDRDGSSQKLSLEALKKRHGKN